MNEPITVSYWLEEVLKRIENKLDKQSEDIGTIKTEIATIKATLQIQQPLIQKIPDLAGKVGELKNWRQILIITITATVSGVIGWFIRGGNLKPEEIKNKNDHQIFSKFTMDRISGLWVFISPSRSTRYHRINYQSFNRKLGQY